MVLFAMTSVVAAREEGRVADVVVGNIGEDAVLDIASQQSFLRKREGEFPGVVSPSVKVG